MYFTFREYAWSEQHIVRAVNYLIPSDTITICLSIKLSNFLFSFICLYFSDTLISVVENFMDSEGTVRSHKCRLTHQWFTSSQMPTPSFSLQGSQKVQRRPGFKHHNTDKQILWCHTGQWHWQCTCLLEQKLWQIPTTPQLGTKGAVSSCILCTSWEGF